MKKPARGGLGWGYMSDWRNNQYSHGGGSDPAAEGDDAWYVLGAIVIFCLVVGSAGLLVYAILS